MNRKSIIIVLSMGILNAENQGALNPYTHITGSSSHKRHHNYKPHTISKPRSNSGEVQNVDLSKVSSREQIRAQFDELANVGVTTHIMRWILYLWIDKSDEQKQQEIVEEQIKEVKSQGEKVIENFITDVRFLQGRMAAIYNKLKTDANYTPNLVFNKDGSLVLDKKEYTLAEVTLADINDLSSIEEVMMARIIRFVISNPLPYFKGQASGDAKDVIKVIRKNFDFSGSMLQKVLAIVCSKDNYKQMNLKLHPDKNGNSLDAQQAFQNYKILCTYFNSMLTA